MAGDPFTRGVEDERNLRLPSSPLSAGPGSRRSPHLRGSSEALLEIPKTQRAQAQTSPQRSYGDVYRSHGVDVGLS